MVVNFGM